LLAGERIRMTAVTTDGVKDLTHKTKDKTCKTKDIVLKNKDNL